MASTAPAKSQPLHNFTLPHHLKWNKDGQSGGSSGGLHHRRRSVKSPSRRPNASSASPVRHSPLRDSVSATPPRHQSPPRETPYYAGKQPSPPAPFSGREWAKRSTISGDLPPQHLRRHDSSVDYHRIHPKADGSRTTIAVPSTNPERTPHQAKSKGKEIEASASKKSKILIKIPCKSTTTRTEEEAPVPIPIAVPIQVPTPIPAAKIENKVEADENMDEETKVWNLRPRKPIRRPVSASGGGGGCLARNNGSEKNKGESKSGETSQKKGGGGGEKKEKKKVSIFLSLTKEEIEEDIFSLTGSKPARRPKKRPKNVQRQVDTLFPGSWLVSISADSYKVSENSLKG